LKYGHRRSQPFFFFDGYQNKEMNGTTIDRAVSELERSGLTKNMINATVRLFYEIQPSKFIA
jgi:hypothetical protein